MPSASIGDFRWLPATVDAACCSNESSPNSPAESPKKPPLLTSPPWLTLNSALTSMEVEASAGPGHRPGPQLSGPGSFVLGRCRRARVRPIEASVDESRSTIATTTTRWSRIEPTWLGTSIRRLSDKNNPYKGRQLAVSAVVIVGEVAV